MPGGSFLSDDSELTVPKSEKAMSPANATKEKVLHKSYAVAFTRGWDDPELWEGLHVVVTEDAKKYEKECHASKLSWPNAKDGKARALKMGRDGRIDKVDPRDKTAFLSDDIKWVPIRALVGFEDWDEHVVTPKMRRIATEAAEAAASRPRQPRSPRSPVAGPSMRYLPKFLQGKRVLVHQGGNRYLVDNTLLQSDTASLGYRKSKDLKDYEQLIRGPAWGTLIEGEEDGDEWVIADTQVQEMQAELREKDRRIAAEEADLHQREEQIAVLQQDLLADEMSNRGLSSRISELDALLRDSAKQLAELRKANQAYKEDLQQRDREISELRRANASCEAALRERERLNAELEKANLEEGADLKDKDKLIHELQRSNRMKDEELVAKSSQNAQLAHARAAAEAELKELEGQHAALQKAHMAGEADLKAKDRLIAELKKIQLDNEADLKARDKQVTNLQQGHLADQAEAKLRDRHLEDLQQDRLASEKATTSYLTEVKDLKARCREQEEQVSEMMNNVSQYLRVTIVSCKGLRDADWMPGGNKSDPFCICKVANKRKSVRSEFRTKTINDNLNPVWNHTATLSDYTLEDHIKFTVLDEDLVGADDLGDAKLEIASILKTGGFDGEVELAHAGKGYHPRLRVKVEVLGNGRVQELEAELKELKERNKQLKESNEAELRERNKCETLVRELNAEIKELKERNKRLHDADESDLNHRTKQISDLKAELKEMQERNTQHLESKEAELKERNKHINELKARCREEEDQVSELLTHVSQYLRVTIVSCKGLRDADWWPGSKSDPFAICKVANKRKSVRSEFRTKTISDNLNPVWNHTATISDYTPEDHLKFHVLDEDLVGADDLGDAKLEIARVLENGGFDGEIELAHAGKGFHPRLHVKVEVLGNGRVQDLEAEVKELKKQIAELQRDKKGLSETLEASESRVEELMRQLRAEKAELQSSCFQRDQTISELQGERRASSERIEAAEAKVSELSRQLQEGKDELHRREQTILQLQGEQQELHQRLKALEATIEERARVHAKNIDELTITHKEELYSCRSQRDLTISELQGERKILQERAAAAEAKVEELARKNQEELVELQSTRSLRDLAVAELQGERAVLLERVEAAEARNKVLLERAENAEAKVEELIRRHQEDMMQLRSEFQTTCSQRDITIAELQGERKVLAERVGVAEAKVDELQRQAQNSQDEFQSVLAQRDAALAELQGERNVLASRVEAAEARVHTLILQHQEELRNQCAQRDLAIAELQGERKILTQRVEGAEAKAKELAEQHREEIVEFQSVCSQRDLTIAEMQGERTALMKRVENSEARQQDWQERAERAESKVDALQRQHTEDEEKFRSACQTRDLTIAELRGEIQVLSERAILAEAKVSQLAIEAEEHRNTLVQRDGTIADLQGKYRGTLERAEIAEAKSTDLTHQREVLHTTCSQRDQTIIEMQREQRALLDRAEGAEAKAMELVRQHQEQRAELQSTCSQRDLTIAELQGERRNLLDNKISFARQHDEEIMELRSTCSARDKVLGELQGERRAMLERVESAEAKILELVRLHQETLQTSCSRRDQVIGELQRTGAVLTERAEAAEAKILELSSTCSQRDRTISELQGELRVSVERVSTAEAKIVKLDSDYLEDKKEFKQAGLKKEKTIAELQGMGQSLLERAESAEAKVSDLHGELRATKERAAHAETTHVTSERRSQEEKLELQSSCTQRDVTISKLHSDLKRAMERASDAEKKAVDAEKTYHEEKAVSSQRERSIAELQGSGKAVLARAEGAEAQVVQIMRLQQDEFKEQLMALMESQQGNLEEVRAQLAEFGEIFANAKSSFNEESQAAVDKIVKGNEELRVQVQNWQLWMSSRYRRLVGVTSASAIQKAQSGSGSSAVPVTPVQFAAGTSPSSGITMMAAGPTVHKVLRHQVGTVSGYSTPGGYQSRSASVGPAHTRYGSADVFDALDLNHDGVLTREEFNAGVAMGVNEPVATASTVSASASVLAPGWLAAQPNPTPSSKLP